MFSFLIYIPLINDINISLRLYFPYQYYSIGYRFRISCFVFPLYVLLANKWMCWRTEQLNTLLGATVGCTGDLNFLIAMDFGNFNVFYYRISNWITLFNSMLVYKYKESVMGTFSKYWFLSAFVKRWTTLMISSEGWTSRYPGGKRPAYTEQ